MKYILLIMCGFESASLIFICQVSHRMRKSVPEKLLRMSPAHESHKQQACPPTHNRLQEVSRWGVYSAWLSRL